jgi:hypothetical protein
VAKRCHLAHWNRFVNEIWPETPLAALEGRTPAQAAGHPDFRLRLTAAVYVLDGHATMLRRRLDVATVCRRLQIDPLRDENLDEQTPLNAYSTMRLLLVPVERLSDRQLKLAINRAWLIHHVDFQERVLREGLSRPSLAGELDLHRSYGMLTAICRAELRHEEALDFVSQGFASVKDGPEAFEQRLHWKLEELSIRADQPDDPELPPLFQHLWDYYGNKLPEIRADLMMLVEHYGLPIPRISDAGLVTAGSVSEGMSPSGVWVPGASEGGEKKLWLPGQT